MSGVVSAGPRRPPWLRARGLSSSRAPGVEEHRGSTAAAAASSYCSSSSNSSSHTAAANHIAASEASAALRLRSPAGARHTNNEPVDFLDFAARQRFSADLLGSLAVLGLILTYSAGIEQRHRKAGAAEAAGAGEAAGAALFFDPPLDQAASSPRLAWCGLVARTVALGDWPWLLTFADYLALTGLLLALWAAAAYRRPNSRLWAWWCRHRDLIISLHVPMGVTLLPLAAFWAALPPPLWRQAGIGPYVAAVASRPLADAVYVTLMSAFLPVRSTLTVAAAAGHVVAMLLISRHVVPTMPLYMRGGGGSASSTGGTGDSSAAPPPLLHELPLPHQLLIAACYVVAPLVLSLRAERRMADSYRYYYRSRRGGGGSDRGSGSSADRSGSGISRTLSAAKEAAALDKRSSPDMAAADQQFVSRRQDHGRTAAAGKSVLPPASASAAANASALVVANNPAAAPSTAPFPQPPLRLPGSATQRSVPEMSDAAMLAPPPHLQVLRGVLLSRARPHSTAGQAVPAAAAPAALPAYRGLTHCAVLSVKVQQHPGSFESYSHRLVQAAPGIMAAAAAQGPCGVAMPQQLTQALVVRGCAQLIAWTRTLVAAAPGPHQQPQQQPLPEARPLLLCQLLPGGDQVSGLAVQQQEAVAAAPAAGGAGSPGVQLLHLAPPVLPLMSAAPAADAQPPTPHEPLRLRLFSPQPQRARLIVVGSSRNGSYGDAGPATAATAVGLHTQQVLAELQVQLCAGEQELELGGGLLQQLLLQAAGSSASGAAAGETTVSRGRALQLLLLLPPVHDDNEQADEATEAEAEPGAPAPLLHFAAPLLVLPADAAAELCGLWGQVAAEAGGDAAAAHARLQPLLSDLCYVLEAAEAEAEEAAEAMEAAVMAEGAEAGAGQGLAVATPASVSSALQGYLRSAGLPAAAAVVERNLSLRNRPSVAHEHVFGEERDRAMCMLSASLSGRASCSGAGSSSCSAVAASASACDRGSDVSVSATSNLQAGTDAASEKAVLPLQPTALAPAPAASGPAVTLRDLACGFSPRQLETQFEAWRAVRLARAAPFVLLITLQPYLLGALRTVRERYERTGAQLTGLALQWLSDSLPHAVLLLRLRCVPRTVAQTSMQLDAAPSDQASGSSNNADASTSGASSSCSSIRPLATDARLRQAAAAAPSPLAPSSPRSSAAAPAAIETPLDTAAAAFEVAAAWASPALFCVAVLLAHVGVLASNDSFVGDARTVGLIVFYRAVVLALALPLPLRRLLPVAGERAASVASALLHSAGTALVLGLAQPDWGVMSLVVEGGATRLLATVVAGVRDWAARRRFLQQRAARALRAEAACPRQKAA
ncbi:hypothetical protein HYH02_006148 [Chlamydomonas schloesseri]|uniref:Uncharacterized protein n=1 Tax=Chlamydomonas schloesseri TaxID=2026947 RepID=A0A835WJL9_9CHLO|nr:hypothetical protein HYH02_006148 [Chlamydomonas schloesseri]|eukprot:KAG2448797.1 hypothetical protein HYH02_006148 [Chlamydomonas schloesseri]